jgi:hypothetical protein
MKKVLPLFMLCFLFACPPNKGDMAVTLSADKEEVNSGGTVNFKLESKEKKIESLTYEITNSDGVMISTETITTLEFSYEFSKADAYSISAIAISNSNYGTAETKVKVTTSLNIPDWKIEENSIMQGEIKHLDITALAASSIKQVDLRLVDSLTNKTKMIKQDISGSASIDTNLLPPGTYKVLLSLKDQYDNISFIEDQLTILDPENPILIEFAASKNDFNVPNTVKVSGTIDSPNPILEIIVQRKCYYGKEPGISPLAEPQHDGNIKYFEDGKAIITHTETYSTLDADSPVTYDDSLKTFNFIDPMPYYDKQGNIETTNFLWDYAKFDREAWKYIKRHKEFDLEKAMTIEYTIKATSTKGSVTSGLSKGYPYLGKKQLATLFIWLKQVTMNRLWKMQVPRFCWGHTALWLQSMNISGQNGGKAEFVRDGLGGYGLISNYSDWTGFKISTRGKIVLDIKLDADNRRLLNYSFDVETPLYSGRFDVIDFGVRDYSLQWGMWAFNKDEGKLDYSEARGTIELYRTGINGKEIITTEELLTMYPIYDGGPLAGNGYDTSDIEGITNHGDPAVMPPTWTKLYFLYPPTGTPDGTTQHPNDSKEGNWGHRGDSDRVINYVYY